MNKTIQDFKCPHCGGFLKVENEVILLFENRTQLSECSSLVSLNPTIGNYETKIHKKNLPQNGDMLKFLCPMCYVDIDSSKNGLCEIDIVADDESTGKLFFAPNMGDYAIIVVWDDSKSLEVVGKDVSNYIQMFHGYEIHEMNSLDAETSRTTTM